MAQDEASGPQQARADESPAVVEWGDEDVRPPGPMARRLARLRADRRLAPIVAGLGGVALLFSLLTEWRIWTASTNELGPGRVETGVVTFPSIGTAYLVGLFALAVCATLTFAGSRSGGVRRHARLAGLAVVGVLLAVLITATASLDQLGGIIEDYYINNTNPEGGSSDAPVVTYGRGLYLAYLGVATVGLALHLAAPARRRRGGPAHEAEANDEAAPAAQAAVSDRSAWAPQDGGDDWPWRSGPAKRPARSPGGPVDLTVEPTTPFLPPDGADGHR
jgi:hypothetical protein